MCTVLVHFQITSKTKLNAHLQHFNLSISTLRMFEIARGERSLGQIHMAIYLVCYLFITR